MWLTEFLEFTYVWSAVIIVGNICRRLQFDSRNVKWAAIGASRFTSRSTKGKSGAYGRQQKKQTLKVSLGVNSNQRSAISKKGKRTFENYVTLITRVALPLIPRLKDR